MSPLAVAHILHSGLTSQILSVVIDESSQMTPENAVREQRLSFGEPTRSGELTVLRQQKAIDHTCPTLELDL